MKARGRDLPAVRLLRVAEWGQVVALEPPLEPGFVGSEADRARIVEEIAVQGPAPGLEAALALADRWRELQQPSLVPLLAASAAAGVTTGARTLRLERAVPRGSHLGELAARTRLADEGLLAALLLDVARALHEAHGRGLVAGMLAPETLFLCPPGLDDQPPLRLFDAGLDALVALATGGLGGAESARFQQVYPCLEVVAPEVMAGQDAAAAADTYALCAIGAFAVLRRHVHAAPTPVQVRRLAAAGLQPADAEALVDAAPTLGPLFVRGLAVHPWGRAGVLAELIEAMAARVASKPQRALGGRTCVAPWAPGSPLIPLAAFASALPFPERFPRSAERAGSRQEPAPGEPTAGPGPADQARLRAALDRLEIERAKSQRQAEARGRQLLARLVAVAVFALIAVAIAVLGVRQTRRYEQSLRPPEARRAAPVVPPKPPPKPRVLYDSEAEAQQ